MTTRSELRLAVANRLNRITTSWSEEDLNNIIGDVVSGLYPAFFNYKVDTTTAGSGPDQTMPTGARNLYMVGLQRVGSNRVRPLRNWFEGDGSAIIPKANITGATLVWAWTSGWSAPVDDFTTIDVPEEAVEVILLRSEIAALEALLASRLQGDVFYAVQVRQGITEDDIVNALQAKHASLSDRLEHAMKLPEVLK